MPIPGICSIRADSNATGTHPAWKNFGTDYTFGPNGQLSPAVNSTTLSNVTVNGVSLGDLSSSFMALAASRSSPIPTATRKSTCCSRTAIPAGSLKSVTVSDKGNIVGTYSNGRTVDLAQITLANFNGANSLKRTRRWRFRDDRGIGLADLWRVRHDHRLVAGRLQYRYRRRIHQADRHPASLFGQYQVITTTNTMVQDLLNMLR